MRSEQTRAWTKRMEQYIPWGSSTCSKAPVFAPEEPGVIVKGKGCRVWDADGNEYIDYRNGLGPITLGYQFPQVDEAIREQLLQGIVFGHPHPLEGEVAEMLCQLIPCADQARFLKTGGEALAATIRLARAYTKREHVIQIGYNGWLNSLSVEGHSLPGQSQASLQGVPAAISALHHAVKWNDLESVESLFKRFPDQIAAIVVAADYADMSAGKHFYPQLRSIATRNGSVLIFDEIVTGFRIAIGGIQQYFDVKPDLAVFGKGIANGMPLSAYVGKKEIMAIGDKGGGAIISSTFGGETLSLAAAKACIQTYVQQNVVDHLWSGGANLWGRINHLFKLYDIDIRVEGFAPCPAFVVLPGAEPRLKELIFRSAFRHGVSLYNTSYINFSHQETDLDETVERLEKACQWVKRERNLR
ncbi:aspartate aminotransferase family protein [Cohnella silvisoli]|uniref:Aminotransferase class III-fold pyridoxal phosphate-dependent enzyme n=1 Tax=Cohnella silvisoli TaxID=2873699 RepID=A0ABV1L0Z3_9BACL|nr:aminotransferase class III-fold pyridoxal phosphate-dependent enzyme [Cohnella silvisoli]MCD9025311.1 aminotransferase class III-fold pyridoxal phosphate-dependent enzyme [Cohnella silvisoli]